MFDLIILLCGLALMFLTYSYANYFLKIPGKASIVMVRRIKEASLSDKELDDKYKPLHEKFLQPIAAWLVGLIRVNRLTKLELQEKLDMAGINKTPEEFMVKQVTTAMGLVIFGAIWAVILGTPIVLLPALILGAFGATLPARDIDRRISEKKNYIIMELPDFLDMLVLTLRAGRNLYSAVKKASEFSGPTLKPLLEKLQGDIELYDNKKDALWKFAENTGVQEVKDFVSALEIGMDARAKHAEEIYRSQSKIMRDLRILALRRHTKSIPAKLNMIHVWLYINCIAIPIIGALVQFGSLMNL